MEPGRVTTTAAASENPGGGVSRVAYEGLPECCAQCDPCGMSMWDSAANGIQLLFVL